MAIVALVTREGELGHDGQKTWASIRYRALCRSVAAVILALWATLLPLLQHPGLVAVCNTYMDMTKAMDVDHTVAEQDDQEWELGNFVACFTAVMSLMCLALVLNSQLQWWLTSPFLVYLRWHVLLNAMNVWLIHFLASHRWCAARDTLIEMTIFTWITVICHLFFWGNKLMGFVVIKSHLKTLEKAFQKSLGSRVLDVLLLLFGLSLLTVTVLYVCYLVQDGRYNLLILGVALIEAAVVVSTSFVAILMTRGFYLAYRAAQREMEAAPRLAEKELATKAVHFSRRLVWETPFNLALVATAFGFHSAWLATLLHGGASVASMSLELGFLLLGRMRLSNRSPPSQITATLSLTNCARFGQLLSLMEYEWLGFLGAEAKFQQDVAQRDREPSPAKWTLSRAAGSYRTRQEPEVEGATWSTGHQEWDGVTHDLACRAISLGALLSFYSRLEERMPHYDPSLHTTADVVRQVIIPMTQGHEHGDCAAALVLMDGQALLPDRMVTHNWANKFSNLVAAVVADALDLPSYASVLPRLQPGEMTALKSELFWRKKLTSTYWICCFAVNQHAGICGTVPDCMEDPVTGELPVPCHCDHPKYWSDTPPLKDGQSVRCEMNKFHDMMGLISTMKPGFAQVIAVDAEFKLFTRAWCVAEIHQAQQLGMQQRMRTLSFENLQQYEGWLHCLKVEEMSASNAADTELILSQIEDKARFNAELQSLIFGTDGLISACHMGFERMAILGAVARQGAIRLKLGLQCGFHGLGLSYVPRTQEARRWEEALGKAQEGDSRSVGPSGIFYAVVEYFRYKSFWSSM
ncbi:unnamed protein product [Symbiodinium natans]|uniref:Uncharacterized protein n=1 Tax=Symbiodinium natans TaxID=878477 RepID=A0A812UA42_9DINO|nr:unnamed protein product [Symbiodinium natans]